MTATSDPVAPPTRVLLIVKGLGLGGAERLLADQAVAGHGGRIEYAVAYVRPDKTHFVEQLRAAGVDVWPLKPAGSKAPWPLHLARILRASRPQVIHSHSPLPAAVARILARIPGIGRPASHVYTEHNRWSAYRLPTRIVNGATMVLDRQVWAVSDEARGSIRPRFLRDRAATLIHGVDLTVTRASGKRAPDAPVPDQSSGTFTYIHVANRRPEKAHEVLLDSFALASASDPDLRLWLVGQRLDDPEFTAAVAANAANGAITVLGARSDAPSLIARADAMVLSSDHEGLPVAVMEALALGRPLVATSVGGIPEAIRTGVEGVLVPPRDPAALADAMVELHQDPDRYQAMVAAASARAAAFDGAIAQRTQEDAYLRLVGSGQAAADEPRPAPR